MRTLKLTVAYDGTAYAGFQRQSRFPAIQNVLEEVLSRLCGEPVQVTGSGRTDAGVHALGQVVSFTTAGRIPTERLVRALNAFLPGDIRALAAEETAPGFNARKDICWKEYRYVAQYTPVPDPFTRNYVWQLDEEPDLRRLQAAAACLLGTHDFGGVGSGRLPCLVYTVVGDGFVYHMVRNLVWSMLQVGLGRKPLVALEEELRLPRGAFENRPAPAQGLYLARVGYTPERPE